MKSIQRDTQRAIVVAPAQELPAPAQGPQQPMAFSDNFFRLVVDSLEDYAIFTVNNEGLVRSWNAGAEKIYGYAADEVLGKHVEHLAPPDRAHEVAQLLRHILLGKAVERYETVRIRKDGARIDVSLTISPLRNEQGAILGASTIARDITDQKQAEAIIARLHKDLERRFREQQALIDLVPIGIAMAEDPQCTRITGNKEFSRMLQVEPDQNDSQAAPAQKLPPFKILQHGKEAPAEALPMRVAGATGKEVRNAEVEIVHPDGRMLHVYCYASPIFDEQSRVRGVIGAFLDISERKHLEQHMAFLSEASKTLSSSLDYHTTLAQVIHLAVPAIADWCAVDMRTKRGARTLVVVPDDPQESQQAPASHPRRKVRVPQTPFPVSHTLRSGTSAFYAELSGAAPTSSAKDKANIAGLRIDGFTSAMIVPLVVRGKAIGAITFAMAQSKRHYTPLDLAMAEEVARRAALAVENAWLYSEAQKAVAVRDEFISIVSHELRTPLTMLKLYTQGMQRQCEKRGEELFSDYLVKMNSQVDKLNLLIDDLLHISKTQSGTLDFHEEAFDLNSAIAEVVVGVQLTAKRHHIRVEGRIERAVWGDKGRIGQALINLLTNAIKYSPDAATVIVRLSSEKDAASVTVQDFGIGIDKEHQHKIFNRFYRIDTPHEKTVPGLGIGLYIAYEIVKRHGGLLSVTSSAGKGSQFRFTLPYSGK